MHRPLKLAGYPEGVTAFLTLICEFPDSLLKAEFDVVDQEREQTDPGPVGFALVLLIWFKTDD